MFICAFENSPSIPSILVTKIVYIGYGQLKKWLLFLLSFHSCAPCRAHRTRRSGRSSLPISAEVALPRLQSEIKVALFLFASHSFLANNLRFMVKLIVKTIFSNSCSIFTLPNPCEKKIDNQRVDRFVLNRWLGEIRISRYFSHKNVTFRKMPLYQ